MESEKKNRLLGTSLRYEELNIDYENILKGEEAEIDDFIDSLSQDIFDYFGLISKEYALSYDRYSADPKFKKDIELEYHRIDCELEDEVATAVPMELSRNRAEELYAEK